MRCLQLCKVTKQIDSTNSPMKRMLILCAVAVLHLQAQSLHWQSNYDDAHHQAVQTSKHLMVLLVDPKDGELNKKILLKSFVDQDYIGDLERDYIAVLITKDQKISYPIELLFTVEYPALFFIDENDLFLCNALVGDMSPDRLKAHLVECQ